jgi:hypothetical protein
MEGAYSYKTLESSYQLTRCHCPEEHNLNLHQGENLRSHMLKKFFTLLSISTMQPPTLHLLDLSCITSFNFIANIVYKYYAK